MSSHQILTLGEHVHGGAKTKSKSSERSMNIACGVVIAVVVVAMIVATILYFTMGKGNTNSSVDQVAPPMVGTNLGSRNCDTDPSMPGCSGAQAASAGPSPEKLQYPDMSASARFGEVPTGDTPLTHGPIFPTLTAQDERELAKSHNANMVKNYPSGYKQAVLNDPKYNMIGNTKPIYGNAAFFPYRGKEDEMIVKLQMQQAKKYDQPFNQSEDQWLWKNKGVRAEFT